jgi:hypothetical protein
MKRIRSAALTLLLPLLHVSAKGQPALELGARRWLFVDHYLIEKLEGGAELRLHHPADRGVVFTCDAPWEGNTSAYHTLVRDGDRYRMYYRGWHHEGGRAAHPPVVACAESDDGLHWTRPNLVLVEFNGSRDNNIVWDGAGSHNFVPFLDEHPDCKPDERYKAVGGETREGGLFGFVSADGLHWRRVREKPILPMGGWNLDSQNVAFWDTVRREYRLYYRTNEEGVRRITTATSPDFLVWSKGTLLTYPDAPTEQLYTNQIQPYHRAPHLFIGFPSRLTRDSNVEGLFMSSRDGRTFKRWGEAIIRAGRNADKWGNRSNYIWCGVVETESDLPGGGKELSIYTNERYYRGPGVKIRRHTYRLDGFASVTAPLSGGRITTPPLVFEGKMLQLNYSTSAAGSVRVEALRPDGAPVPGLDSGELWGDAVDQPLPMDFGALAGQPIKLRFTLKDADVFAFRFGQE